MREGTGLLPLYSRPLALQFLVMMLVILFTLLVVSGVDMLLTKFFFDQGVTADDIVAGEPGGSGRGYLLYSMVVSQLSLFLIPGLIIAWMMQGDLVSWFGLKGPLHAGEVLLVLLLAGSVIPLSTAAGYINSVMELPGWLSGVEIWIRKAEDQAMELTEHLVYADSTGGVAVNIVVLALLPAVAEEILFRGVIQRMMHRWLGSGIAAVVVTSLLFSALHLQFYSFLPRFILGMIFGLLYLWGGTIWLPVIAHFGNNIVPVILSYFRGWTYLNNSVSDYMPTDIWQLSGMILLPSALLIVVYMLTRERKEKESGNISP